jgi:hypothetical protein
LLFFLVAHLPRSLIHFSLPLATMRFTAIFFLTASLVNVAFSYTAKELDTIQQHLTQLKSDLDSINVDLSKISGADGTFPEVIVST